MSDALNPYEAPSTPITQQPLPSAPALESATLASRGIRFVARLADQLLFVVVVLPFAMWALPPDAMDAEGSLAAFETVPMLLAFGVGSALWIYQTRLIARTGQSLAKRLFGIRIVCQRSGENPGFWRAVAAREWVFLVLGFVPGIGSLVGFADALPIFGSKRHCLHDRMAKTNVVVAR